MLHGCTQDADDFAAGTRMNEAARERGWCVLYPAQAQEMNPSRCWNWFKTSHQRRDRGEPEILNGMTLEVMLAHGIDPRRVYVAGLSAGGAMAAILGATYPERFAAVGVHSGLPVGAAADANSAFAAMRGAAAAEGSSAAPPTIVFHGDQDATVHPVNGERVAAAAGRNAEAAAPESLGAVNGRDCTRKRWRDAAGRIVAEHWLVHGAGHAWSGGSARGSHSDVRGPDASAEMLRFFAQHVLA
jgi:poly(hydroxyalkanoate) depolymerase family esterase